MTTLLHPDKIEAQKQWDNDPCGASTVPNLAPETLEFYRQVRQHRYQEYAPWFQDVVRFDEFYDKDILEIGVGLGSDHYSFAKNGNRMTALDLSGAHLRHTARHQELEGLTTRIVEGDAESMPFDDNSFDVVYSFGVLMHTPDTARAFTEVHRVLRPGGVAILGIYNRYSWFFLISVLLTTGILKLELFRKGWRRLLAQIEYRSPQNNAIPLVKVYSRRNLKSFCRPFSRVEITSCHVEHSHFRFFRYLLAFMSRDQLERYLGLGGWFLVVHAYK